MNFLKSQAKTSRLKFISIAAFCIFIIIFMPSILNSAMAAFLGTNNYAAVYMILRMILLPVGLVLVSIPLIIFTKARLNDLGLSPIPLILFPVFPLLYLAHGPITAVTSLGISTTPSFLLSEKIWLGAITLAFLAITKPDTPSNPHDNKFLKTLQKITNTTDPISLKEYRQSLLVMMLIYIAICASSSLASFTINKMSLAVPVYGSTTYAIITMVIRGVQTILILSLIGPTIRRLKVIGQPRILALFFPFLLGGLSSLILTLAYCPMSTDCNFILKYKGISQLSLASIEPISALMCLCVFVMLLFKREKEELDYPS